MPLSELYYQLEKVVAIEIKLLLLFFWLLICYMFFLQILQVDIVMKAYAGWLYCRLQCCMWTEGGFGWNRRWLVGIWSWIVLGFRFKGLSCMYLVVINHALSNWCHAWNCFEMLDLKCMMLSCYGCLLCSLLNDLFAWNWSMEIFFGLFRHVMNMGF